MPLRTLLDINTYSKLIIWDITEEEAYFKMKLEISFEEASELESLSPKRRKEWLLPRYIAKLISTDNQILISKDEHNKPFFTNDDRHMSISHSKDRFAMLISNSNCGVDIQHFTEKINIIAKKFVTEKEELILAEMPSLDRYHLIWSAKEAIYKIYGRRQLDFRKHIKLTSAPNTTTFHGAVIKDEYVMNYNLAYFVDDNYMIVYGFESR